MTTLHHHLVVLPPCTWACPIITLPLATPSCSDTLWPCPILPSHHALSCHPLSLRYIVATPCLTLALLFCHLAPPYHHAFTLGPVPTTPLTATLSFRCLTPSHLGHLTLL